MQLKHSLTHIGSAAFLLATAPTIALAVDNPFKLATNSLTGTGGVQASAGITGGSSDVYVIAGKIINVVLGFLGIVLLGYMLYAGFLWMTSGGEKERAEQARTMIINSIIGLVIIVAAFAISGFVLSSLVNVATTT